MLIFHALFVFFIAIVFFTSLVHKQKKIYISVFIALLSLAFMMELSSVYMTNTLIDYRFYTHLNMEMAIEQSFQFGFEIFIAILFYFLLCFSIYIFSMWISMLFTKKTQIIISITLLGILSFPQGVINEVYHIYEMLYAKEKRFGQALQNLGIAKEAYISPSQLQAIKGKNIIVISLESVEQGFLTNDSFDNLTPYLTALSKEWTFYNKMFTSGGGEWTAGSLYSYQVGIPAYFKGQGNAFFQGISAVNLTGLGHVLSKAGYDARYIVGNAEFAGMKDLLKAYKIQVISQNNCISQIYDKTAKCGLHDYDLFQEAKKQIQDFKRMPHKPFALFMSTINTHFPNGIYDERMEKFVKKRKDGVRFSVSAVDYLVGDFLAYLKTQHILEHTAIFIFPDHLLMGSTGENIKKLKEKARRIYLITNIKEASLPKNTQERLYQIDLPQMIINGARIKTNAKFLSDFIPHKNYDTFLNAHKVDLTILNSASLIKKDFTQGIHIHLQDKKLLITSGSYKITFNLEESNVEVNVFDITFNQEMVSISKEEISLNERFLPLRYDERYKRLHLFIEVKKHKLIQASFGKTYKNEFKMKLAEEENIEYTKEEIQAIKAR